MIPPPQRHSRALGPINSLALINVNVCVCVCVNQRL
eukprot:SAG25_NODE_2171_length_1878_cov_4.103991_2_plen_35_part_01